MEIQDGAVVEMHYTLKNDAGETLDSSEGQDPLVFLQGGGDIIGGVETALLGKSAGDSMDLVVEPEDGYGPRMDELIQEVPRDSFQGVDELQVGMQFEAETPNGPMSIAISAIEGDVVTVDANHELAGQRLHFSIKIESVRAATEEELSSGGPG